MAANIAGLEKRLIEAVEITLEPTAPAHLRRDAYEFIEKFKGNLELCLTVGLDLFSKDYSAMVRHVGLQMMEHSIRFNWNAMSKAATEEFKLKVIDLLAKGTKSVSEEAHHIKESLARLAVEVAKREWPQNWASFLSELCQLCLAGNTQTELVLMVLLRLAEDGQGMDANLQQQRKKEIMTALNNHSEEIFVFLISVLDSSSKKLKETKTNPELQKEATECRRVAEQALLTMVGYLEWVKMTVLLNNNCILFQTLYLLLAEEDLRIPAAECLLFIVKRKAGKGKERLFYLEQYKKFFSADAMEIMLTSTRNVATCEYEEKKYLFLKRICQVLTTLGTVQLSQMWYKEIPDGKPENFKQYLEILLAFSQHESLALSNMTNHLWLSILRNEVMVQDEDVRAAFPHLLELGKLKTLRADRSDSSGIPGGIFNREDFNSAREFSSVFSGVRSQMMDIICHVTTHFPLESFLCPAEWLLDTIEKTKLLGKSGDPKAMEQLIIQWDGMSKFIEAVMPSLVGLENIKEVLGKEITFKGTQLTFLSLIRYCFETLLGVNPENCNEPRILGSVVDIIKSMMPIMVHAQDLILNVMNIIFKFVTFNTTGNPKPPWSTEVLHTRRVACSAVQRMCKQFGHLLMPVFDEIKKFVYLLFEEEVITIQDRSVLTEGLVIASNNIKDESEKNQFLTELLAPFKDLLMTDKFTEVGVSAEVLIAYLGMNQDPSQYNASGEDIRRRRFKLMLGLSTMLAVTRRCKVIEPTAGDSGTDLTGLTPGGSATDAVPSPALPHIRPFLPYLLVLLQSVNNLYGPAGRAAMHPGYLQALEMHDTEKCAIFALDNHEEGQRPNPSDSDVVAKTKHYIFYFTEACYNTLGHAGVARIYNEPALALCIVERVIDTLRFLPNYRLRLAMRQFLRPYVACCPPECHQVAILPVLLAFFGYMLQHLDGEWTKVRIRQTESWASGEERDSESKEVIENQLVHLITKDYMDVFSLAFTTKRLEEAAIAATDGDTEMDQGVDDETASKLPKSANTEDVNLGPLGETLLENESVNEQLLYTVFSAFTWLDSSACNKACRLCLPVVKKIMEWGDANNRPIMPPVVEQLYRQVLRGLQVQGGGEQHLIRIATLLYAIWAPRYPTIAQVLQQATGCDPVIVQQFHTSIRNIKANQRKQKDLLTKIVQPIIQKHIGQLFKNEIRIKDLPAIPVPPRKEKESVEDEEGFSSLKDLFDPKKAEEIL